MLELHDKVRIIGGGADVYLVTGLDRSKGIYRLQLLRTNIGPVTLKHEHELELVAKVQGIGDGIYLVPTSCEQFR